MLFRKPQILKLWPLLRYQLYFVGVLSCVIIVVSALFIGMVVGLQGFNTLQKFGASSQLGQLLALSIARELGPVISALLFAGRAGSALTAEIGLMKATEQLSSMDMMGVDPLGRVVYPQRTMPGTLTSALQLRAVSEWGVSIWGAHQLLQGTWVNFKSEQLQHILGERSPRNAGLQMKVVSVSKDPEPLQDGRQFYCATLEFDRVKLPQAARRSLRRWLKENVPS